MSLIVISSSSQRHPSLHLLHSAGQDVHPCVCVQGEVLTPPQLCGALITLAAVFMINNRKALPAPRGQEEAS